MPPQMKLMRTTLITLLIAMVSATAASGDIPPFDRYQVIIDRKPFGAPPPIPEQKPTATVIPPEQSFARAMRLSMIVKDNETGEIKVGIVDDAAKTSLTLRVGEEDQGVELVSADYEAEEAVLRKGAEMAIVKLGAGAIKPLPPSKSRTDTSRRGPPRMPTRTAKAPEKPAAPVQPRYTGEELRKHLQDYNVEVIKQGLPPLPIQLTPAQDAQLVREGVLPPQ